MNIGGRLRSMRKNAGLTQEAVADVMNVTRQTLSNWERGVNLPDIFAVSRLAAVYRVSLDEIFLGKTFFKGGKSMKTNYSDAQIETLIKRHHPDACAVQVLSGGLVSQTFSFRSGMKKFIFQIGGKKEAYEKERYVGERYRALLPVRVVRGVHVNAEGRAYCFSDYIEGSRIFDLNHQARIDIVPAVLEFLMKTACVALPGNVGYGRFDERGFARFDSWRAFVSSIYSDGLYDWQGLEAKKFDVRLIQRTVACLQKNMDCIDVERPCLVHGDIGSYNLLVEGNRVSGALDWSLSLYGDPLYDVANVLFWNEDKLQPLIAALEARHMPDERGKRKLSCYMIRIGLEEIYNTVLLDEIGYDVAWVANRLGEITDQF